MDCPKCGKQNSEDNPLCSSCGWVMTWPEEKPKSRRLRVTVVLVVLATLTATLIVLLRSYVVQPRFHRWNCGLNLNTIYKDLLVYAIDCDYEYPTANKWCDLLLAHPTHSFVVSVSFRCPAHKNHKCSYAMNPNCEPNSPGDMVLLFETKDGWNQFGGPQLLTFDNHGGKGCNILFNDGHIEFIRPSQASKLKWNVDKAKDE